MTSPTRSPRRLLASLWIAWWVGATPVGAAIADSARDAGPRATLVLDERALAVGVVGDLVIAVRTPVGDRVLPIELPPLEAAEYLRADTQLEEHPGGGWLHRIHLRVRPLAAGPLHWPALEVRIEAPDGGLTLLSLPERVFEVDSVMRGPEDDRAPYGFQDPIGQPEAASGLAPGLGIGIAVGSTGTLALMALLGRVRARRANGTGPTGAIDDDRHADASPSPTNPLAPARDVLDEDPRLAATRAAMTLRALASARFHVELRATPTGELRRARRGSASDADFSDLLRLLERLDGMRFPDRALTRDEVARLLESAEPLALRWAAGRAGNR